MPWHDLDIHSGIFHFWLAVLELLSWVNMYLEILLFFSHQVLSSWGLRKKICFTFSTRSLWWFYDHKRLQYTQLVVLNSKHTLHSTLPILKLWLVSTFVPHPPRTGCHHRHSHTGEPEGSWWGHFEPSRIVKGVLLGCAFEAHSHPCLVLWTFIMAANICLRWKVYYAGYMCYCYKYENFAMSFINVNHL